MDNMSYMGDMGNMGNIAGTGDMGNMAEMSNMGNTGVIDITLLRRAALHSVTLMISVILLSCATDLFSMLKIKEDSQQEQLMVAENIYNLNINKLSAKLLDFTPAVNEASAPVPVEVGDAMIDKIKRQIEPEVLQILGKNFLMIDKPDGNSLQLKAESIYINKSIQIDLTGITDNIINSDMITRVRDEDVFTGDPVYTELITVELDEDDQTSKEVISRDYGRDLSHGITITITEDTANKLYSARLLLTLDSVYEYFIYEDEKHFYIDLRKPSEIYDKIVVIDAGHGGKDGGAVSRDEKYCEKDINLDILLRLKKLLDASDIKAYYTRTEDKTVYLRPRAELANAVDADYFISIHCNSNESTSPNGMEVLYYDNAFKGVKTRNLAYLFSLELEKKVDLRQKGIVRRKFEDLYIMDKSVIPTILLEIGYMSNKKDLAYLTDVDNRNSIAEAIFNGILRAYNELPVIKGSEEN